MVALPSQIQEGPEVTPDEVAEDVRQVREVFGALVKRKGPKRIAYAAGRKGDNADKVLNAAMAGRDGNAVRDYDLIAAVRLDPSGSVLQAIANVVGAEVRMPSKFTAEEKYERVFAYLSRYLKLEILDEARGYAEGRR